MGEFEPNEDRVNGPRVLFYSLLFGLALWLIIFVSVYMLWLWAY